TESKQRRCAEEHERIVRPVSQQSERRKNLSFSNQQVREIDRENRRLLNEITRSRKQPRPSSASSVRSTTSVRSDATDRSRRSTASRASSTSTQRHKSSKQTKLYHSTINRINYQRQVERENLKMLKRLQGCKPTPGFAENFTVT
uniref:Cilia- and flagella-associated protein 97 n=1 Tax=Ciona savignyi TaxID=51511 RepID=H2YW29_CIOSA